MLMTTDARDKILRTQVDLCYYCTHVRESLKVKVAARKLPLILVCRCHPFVKRVHRWVLKMHEEEKHGVPSLTALEAHLHAATCASLRWHKLTTAR